MVQKQGPKTGRLAVEFTAIYIAFPLFMYTYRVDMGKLVIPILLVTGSACLLVLRRDADFDRRQLWNPEALRMRLRPTMIRFALGAAMLAYLVWRFEPENLLSMPRKETLLWLLLMVLYPILSVYPQEIIFRTFLFHRYRPLFRRTRHVVVASGIVFGLAHIFLANWIAPLLSTIGGFLFALTYAKTRSTLQASLEHGLWGDFLFTLGLGWYFYGGAVAETGGL